MTDPVRPIFGKGRLRLSRIAYHCDLNNLSGPTIPLGVIADIRSPTVYGLSLRARVNLAAPEVEMLGALVRSSLSKPFDYLQTEFQRIWRAAEPSKEFAALPGLHYSSLRFEPLTSRDLRIPVHVAIDDSEKTQIEWAKLALRAETSEEFMGLLAEHWPAAAGAPEDKALVKKAA